MSKPHWDALVEQLKDPDPKARRRACQQLARLDDPKAIPFLRTAYLQEDDERVRQAAARALAAYKALLQSGQPVRRLPFSDALLGRIAAGLLILLAASLILHGAVKVLESRDDGEEAEPADDVQTEPLDRDVLVSRLEAKFQEIEQIASGLRGELNHYHATGEIACSTSQIAPQPAALALIDQQVYRDLGLIGSKLDGTLPPLQIAQLRWGRVCETKTRKCRPSWRRPTSWIWFRASWAISAACCSGPSPIRRRRLTRRDAGAHRNAHAHPARRRHRPPTRRSPRSPASRQPRPRHHHADRHPSPTRRAIPPSWLRAIIRALATSVVLGDLNP